MNTPHLVLRERLQVNTPHLVVEGVSTSEHPTPRFSTHVLMVSTHVLHPQGQVTVSKIPSCTWGNRSTSVPQEQHGLSQRSRREAQHTLSSPGTRGTRDSATPGNARVRPSICVLAYAVHILIQRTLRRRCCSPGFMCV